jgi:hypothetical protein
LHFSATDTRERRALLLWLDSLIADGTAGELLEHRMRVRDTLIAIRDCIAIGRHHDLGQLGGVQ